MDVSVITLATTEIYYFFLLFSIVYNFCCLIKFFFFRFDSHLHLNHELAHEIAEPPVAGDVVDHCVGQTYENDEEVADGQVEYEYVGDCAHVRVLQHHEYDEQVAHDADEEDERGDERQTPLECAQLELVDVEDHVAWTDAIVTIRGVTMLANHACDT